MATSATWVVALVGDSHAGMLIPFLDRLGRRDHFRVVMYQKLGCAPYDVEQRTGELRTQCDEFRAWTMTKLRVDQPNVVIAYGRGFLYVNPGPGETVAGLWKAGVESAVNRFRSLGARVVLVGDVPAHTTQPRACIEANQRASACMIAPTSPESQSNLVTQRVAIERHLDYVPMEQFACLRNACPLVVGTRILYWDPSHVTRSWIDHISPALAQHFEPLVKPRPAP